MMAARKLDLRTGRTVWQAYRAPAVPFSPLTKDIGTDVLIVGAGISGAMIAEALSAEGLDVAIIDRRKPMAGSTMATTALVQFEIDQPLSLLARKIGRERAERAWRRSRLAVANLQARIGELGIDCRMKPRNSLYLAGNVLDIPGLHAEADARRRAGLYADYLSAGMLRDRFGLDRDAALLSHGNLTLDPRRLTAGMLLAALRRKTRIHAPAEAVRFHTTRDEVTVETGHGPTIRAGHVVLATGYELTSIVPDKGHRIISTYAIATRAQPRALPADMPLIWEASDPYLYLRATHDGRIICGGEDEEFTDEERRDALIPQKTAAIARKLGRLLGNIDPTPEFAWAGAFGSTETGLPILGPVPGKPRILAVLGYGGNGITFSRIAAELVCGMICGRGDADANLFAFNRKAIRPA
jgi:glycine/D-amino acid oxidase-like deaminating enzyme